MGKDITDEDLDLLAELGVDKDDAPTDTRPARIQRIVGGFDEIVNFYILHGRPPHSGEKIDILERILAARLDAIRESDECRQALKDMDKYGLIDQTAVTPMRAPSSDDELLSELGVSSSSSTDVTNLVHVRSREEINAAEEIAKRNSCKEFDLFRPLFDQVKQELKDGKRETRKYADNAEIQVGNTFILDGQTLIVADIGKHGVDVDGRPNPRLRVIYDNGTESDLLLRSLQRALNKDKRSRRITDPGWGPVFSQKEEPDDIPSGFIYVLRSKSEQPFIAQNRQVIHKIGVTGGEVTRRIANAKVDPTFLLADVEIVATFRLSNIKRHRLEALLHKIFSSARLELHLPDRFGFHVEPREWFLVPFHAIEEAIKMIIGGTIGKYRYDVKSASLVTDRQRE